MKKLLTIIIASTSCLTVLSAQEVAEEPARVVMYERGYRADIELGMALLDQFYISTSQGFSFGNGLYVGGGAGFSAEFKPDIKSDPVYLIPVFADLKYTFLHHICSPFLGIRAGEVIDITKNGLRAFINPSIGVDIARFTIKVGYEFQYGVMGADEGRISQYAKFGVGFSF